MSKYLSTLIVALFLLITIAANALAYFIMLRYFHLPDFLIWAVSAALLLTTLAIFYVIYQRIIEIKEGYEDDLDNY